MRGLILSASVVAALAHDPSIAMSSGEELWKVDFDSGVLARRAAHYSDAERSFRDAVKEAEAIGPRGALLVRSLNELGTVLCVRRQFDEAHAAFQRALSITTATHGTDNPDAAASIFGLGSVAGGQGNAEEAEPLFKRALAIQEKTVGVSDPATARTLCALATLKMGQQDFGQARQLLQRALPILEKNPGDEPKRLAIVLVKLGQIYEQQHKDSEAGASYERAVVEAEKVLPADHPDLALVQLSLGQFKQSQRDFAGAIALFEHALPFLVHASDPDELEIASYKADFADAYVYLERFVDAERMYSESLPILERSLGKDDPRLKDALAAYEELKKHNAAQSSGTTPTYETRYINGTQFQVGTAGDLQVWMAVWKGDELQTMIYVINGSDHEITFFPEQVQVEALKQAKLGTTTVPLKTFTAEEYEQKMRSRNSNARLLAALGVAAASLNSQGGETYQTRGDYDVSDRYGSRVGSMSYSGTITRLPSATDQQVSLDRARARGEALRAQLDASFQAVAQNLMRTNTLEPNAYYGGMVYSKKSGNDYVMMVPFGENTFQFSFSFN